MSAIYSVLIWIVTGIYHIAALGFEIFLILASGNLVSSDTYSAIITNSYLVIGVMMLFFIAFSLLKGMVNPDDQKKGTTAVGKIVINLITSGIIIVLLPIIFTFLFNLQDSIVLTQNTIGAFFNYGSLSGQSEKNGFDEIQVGSYKLVNGVFTAFFNVDSEYCQNDLGGDLISCQKEIKSDESYSCGDEIENKNSLACAIENVDSTGAFGNYTDFSYSVSNGEIDFNFLLSLVAGALICYISISYCLDMGLRLVKLVFYQIIAPIPVLSRIVPEGNFSDLFNKWLKVTLTCYLEVYVRIFVLYFSIYLCRALIEQSFLNSVVARYGILIGGLAKAFVIMGIVMFMREIPNLLKSFGLDSGNMKLGIRDKLKNGGFFAATNAVGGLVAGSGLTTAIKNRNIKDFSFGNGLKNAYRGVKYGFSNSNSKYIGAAAKNYKNLQDSKVDGSTFSGRMSEQVRDYFGIESGIDEVKRKTQEWYNYSSADHKFTTKNDTGVAIGKFEKEKDANGNETGRLIMTNPILDKGVGFTFGYQSVNELNDLAKELEVQKQETMSDSKRLKAYSDKNKELIAHKSTQEKIAESKILNQNQYKLKDENRKNLTLEFTDSNGIRHVLTNGTNKQFLDWFEKNKELMSDEDNKRLSGILNKSQHDWSVHDYVDNDGRDYVIKQDENGNEIVDYNNRNSGINEDIFSDKYKTASDIIENGFRLSDDSVIDVESIIDDKRYNEVIENLKSKGIENYEALTKLHNIAARGIDIKDARTLAENMTFKLVKDIKGLGEKINAEDIGILQTNNSYAVSQYESVQGAIKEILDEGKAQQESQEQSAMFRTKKANYEAIRKDNSNKN